MKQFLAGFVLAALIATGLLYAQAKGMVVIFAANETAAPKLPAEPVVVKDTDTADEKKKTRKGKRRTAGNRTAGSGTTGATTGDGEVGDSLEAGAREMNGATGGDEQQLSTAQIEAGVDRVFSGIERCLMLMPPEAPSSGRVVIGMNIAATGQVTRVNLKGSNAMISGECGACIQRMVKSIRYPAFNGPDMIAHYPVSFD